MAEALAIASGIAGLLALTIEVYATSSKYVVGVRGAKAAIQEVLRELRELKIILSKLDSVFEYAADEELAKRKLLSSTAFENADEYLGVLETLRQKLESEAGGNSFSSKVKALKWPFSEEKTKWTVDILKRHVENFRAIMDIDAFGMIADTLVGVGRLERHKDDERTKTILKWFSPLEMSKSQVDRFSQRHKSSGIWLLVHPTFLDWVNQRSKGLLWCPGNAGAGKSVLSSIIIDDLLRNQASATTAITYIYCDHKDPENQTATALVGSILKQLLAQLPTLPLWILDFYDKLSSKNDIPTSEQMLSLVLNTCKVYKKTFLVVDALDECEARRSFLPVLEQLGRAGVRVLVTSRPHKPDIADFFRNSSRLDIVASDDDIKLYVEEQISSNFKHKELAEELSEDMRQTIVSTITKNAQGLFLIAIEQARIICQSINGNAIKKSLLSMPSKTIDIYLKAIERIKKHESEEQDYAFAILAWVSYAKRPLHVNEVQHALAIQFACHDKGRPSTVDPDDLLPASFLVDVCESLVTIEKESQVIRLSHYTVQEYLETVRGTIFPRAQHFIAATCIEYLLLDAFADGPSSDNDALNRRLQQFCFLQYAACHWGEHVRGPMEIEMFDLIMELLKDNEKACNAVQALDSVDSEFFRWCNGFGARPDNFQPLHNAASQGLDFIVQNLLDSGVDITITDGTFKSAAHWAAWAGHESTVEVLLDSGFKLHSICDKFTLIEVACDQGRESVVRLLLDRGFRINVRGFAGHTALCTSAQMGRLDIVKLLLSLGADPSIPTMFGESPVACAAWNGHTEVVELLLALQLDINSKSMNGATALHGAARLGQLDTVKALVVHGAKLNCGAISGETPLHVAAIGGFDRVIRYLLDRGADIDQKCSDEDLHNCEKVNSEIGSCPERMFCIGRCIPGSTALIEAARFGHKEAVELLLSSRASVDMKSKSGFTALTIAIANAHVEVADVLYDAGAKIQENGQLGSDMFLSIAIKGSVGAVKWLLKHGASLEFREKNGNTPLCTAAREGRLEVVEYLVEQGAMIDVQGETDRTPLLLAALNDHQKVVLYLISKGADMEFELMNNVLHGLTMLFVVAARGQDKMTTLLIEQGANVHAQNQTGQTPLHWACWKGQPDVAQVLIDNGAEVDGTGAEEDTPLILAINANDDRLVQILLDAGASPTEITYQGGVLHRAVETSSASLMEKLINAGAVVDSEIPDATRNTALHIAASQGLVEIIAVLVKAGADIDKTNADGLSALDIALINEDGEVLRALEGSNHKLASVIYDESPRAIELDEDDDDDDNDNGGDNGRQYRTTLGHLHIDSWESQRETPHYEPGAGFLTIEPLPGSSAVRGLSRSPMPPTIHNVYDESDEEDEDQPTMRRDPSRSLSLSPSNQEITTLINAVTKNDTELVRALLRQNPRALNHGRDGDRRSALHVAAFMQTDRIARLLIKHGADVYAEDSRGYLPIHCSARSGNVKVLQLLLNEGVDPNVTDDHGCSPLTLASEYGYLECVQALLATDGINVNAYDNDDDSSILMAADKGHTEIVAQLLKFSELDVRWKNKRGDAALGLAFRAGHTEIHRMLKQFLATNPPKPVRHESVSSEEVRVTPTFQVDDDYDTDDYPESQSRASPESQTQHATLSPPRIQYSSSNEDSDEIEAVYTQLPDAGPDAFQVFYVRKQKLGSGRAHPRSFQSSPQPSPQPSPRFGLATLQYPGDSSSPRNNHPTGYTPAQNTNNVIRNAHKLQPSLNDDQYRLPNQRESRGRPGAPVQIVVTPEFDNGAVSSYRGVPHRSITPSNPYSSVQPAARFHQASPTTSSNLNSRALNKPPTAFQTSSPRSRSPNSQSGPLISPSPSLLEQFQPSSNEKSPHISGSQPQTQIRRNPIPSDQSQNQPETPKSSATPPVQHARGSSATQYQPYDFTAPRHPQGQNATKFQPHSSMRTVAPESSRQQPGFPRTFDRSPNDHANTFLQPRIPPLPTRSQGDASSPQSPPRIADAKSWDGSRSKVLGALGETKPAPQIEVQQAPIEDRFVFPSPRLSPQSAKAAEAPTAGKKTSRILNKFKKGRS